VVYFAALHSCRKRIKFVAGTGVGGRYRFRGNRCEHVCRVGVGSDKALDLCFAEQTLCGNALKTVAARAR
jgi:hypothetical protein